jgi:hypothetical protein
MAMQTLWDFLTQTKAHSYLVGLLFLLAFIPFWRFLTEREPQDRLSGKG